MLLIKKQKQNKKEMTKCRLRGRFADSLWSIRHVILEYPAARQFNARCHSTAGRYELWILQFPETCSSCHVFANQSLCTIPSTLRIESNPYMIPMWPPHLSYLVTQYTFIFHQIPQVTHNHQSTTHNLPALFTSKMLSHPRPPPSLHSLSSTSLSFQQMV